MKKPSNIKGRGGCVNKKKQKPKVQLTAITTHFLALFAKSTPIVLPSIFNGGWRLCKICSSWEASYNKKYSLLWKAVYWGGFRSSPNSTFSVQPLKRAKDVKTPPSPHITHAEEHSETHNSPCENTEHFPGSLNIKYVPKILALSRSELLQTGHQQKLRSGTWFHLTTCFPPTKVGPNRSHCCSSLVYRLTEPFRLERTFKIIESNH